MSTLLRFRRRPRKFPVLRQGDLMYRYAPDSDALAITVDGRVPAAKTIQVDDSRFVDLDAEGNLVGIEILWVSRGFNLMDLVDRFGLFTHEQDLKEIQNTSFPDELTP